MEEEAKPSRPRHDLHIRFSFPLSSVNEACDRVGVAAKVITKLKRWLKRARKAPVLRNSASFTKLPFNSSDPFDQGDGFEASTPENDNSATLVLRLPDERCTGVHHSVIYKGHALMILHRSANSIGKFVQDHTSLGWQVPTQAETQAHRWSE